MAEQDLAFYKQALSALRMDSSSGRKKPYKVCLLLSVFDLIADGLSYQRKTRAGRLP